MSRGTTDDDDAFEEIRKAQAEDLKQLPAKVQAAQTRLAAFSRDHRRANLYKCGPMGLGLSFYFLSSSFVAIEVSPSVSLATEE